MICQGNKQVICLICLTIQADSEIKFLLTLEIQTLIKRESDMNGS